MAGHFPQNLRRAICFCHAPYFTLIDTRHWYVIANFRETDLKIFAQVHPQRFA